MTKYLLLPFMLLCPSVISAATTTAPTEHLAQTRHVCEIVEHEVINGIHIGLITPEEGNRFMMACLINYQ